MSNWSDDARSSNTRETCASIRGHASKLPLSSSYCVSSTLELDCVRPTIERLVDPSVTRLNGHRFTFAYSRGYFKYLVRTFDLGGFRAPPFKIVSCCSVNFKDLRNSIYIYIFSISFQVFVLFYYRARVVSMTHVVFVPRTPRCIHTDSPSLSSWSFSWCISSSFISTNLVFKFFSSKQLCSCTSNVILLFSINLILIYNYRET